VDTSHTCPPTVASLSGLGLLPWTVGVTLPSTLVSTSPRLLPVPSLHLDTRSGLFFGEIACFASTRSRLWMHPFASFPISPRNHPNVSPTKQASAASVAIMAIGFRQTQIPPIRRVPAPFVRSVSAHCLPHPLPSMRWIRSRRRIHRNLLDSAKTAKAHYTYSDRQCDPPAGTSNPCRIAHPFSFFPTQFPVQPAESRPTLEDRVRMKRVPNVSCSALHTRRAPSPRSARPRSRDARSARAVHAHAP
jgi:hypothetical protein